MKMLSGSSCALLLLTLLYAVSLKMLSESSVVLLLTLLYVALALGVKNIANYWNEGKFDFSMNVEYVAVGFTHVNVIGQQLMAVTREWYCYDWRFAWAAFAASFFHLLGAGSAYIVNKHKLQMLSAFIALILLGLSGISITSGLDFRAQAFLFCQLLLFAFRLYGLIPKYYLLLDGLTVPLSLVSTGDARIKFKVSEEDSHLLKLDPSSWLQVREDYANMFKFEPNVCHNVILSVFSIEDNIINFTLKNYRAQVFKSEKES